MSLRAASRKHRGTIASLHRLPTQPPYAASIRRLPTEPPYSADLLTQGYVAVGDPATRQATYGLMRIDHVVGNVSTSGF